MVDKKHVLNRFQSLQPSAGRFLACLTLVAFSLGCSKEKIVSYSVPKETNEPMAVTQSAAPAAPHLDWTLPTGWTEKPGDTMRLAAFDIKGPDGQTAEVTIVPLRGVSDIELQSVNMWREKIALKPITQEELAKIEKPVEVAGTPAKFYDMAGETAAGGKSKPRVTAAILPRAGTMWFFKMTGDDNLVSAQKEAFLGFLKSLAIHEDHAAPAVASTQAAPRQPQTEGEAPAAKSWKVPAGWQEQAPSAMVMASYSVPGENGAKADVSISMFPGDVGGTLANVNRWRGQIGLAPVGTEDLPKVTSAADLDGLKATLVDMVGKSAKTGREARLVAAIVPREGNTWFYKLMGDGKVVEREKAPFLEFIKTAR